ncbi:MAG: lipid-A-disaccharide synthase, partial [Chthoniobacterales bacterium]|nr:lipid-A-disaccharide synthase [Chthoniobacterales bacterium]
RHYPWFHAKFHSLLSQILLLKPAALLLIDYPGFNLRLATAVKKKLKDIKVIYYISPQVWAWNPNRVKKMRGTIDLMLCIFPFEPKIYQKVGIRALYVGHPLVEELAELANQNIPRNENLVALLPGSREREVRKIFPTLLATASQIHLSRPEIQFASSSTRHDLALWMQKEAQKKDIKVEITVGSARQLMKRAAVGIVCSGTATLEAALLGLPYALVYKTAWLTYEIARRVITVQHLGIVNILAGKTVVREFLQHNCTPTKLADETLSLLNCHERRFQLIQEMKKATSILRSSNSSRKAAEAIAALL